MRLAVAGHTGRVGKELIQLIYDSNGKFIFVAGWNSEGPKMIAEGFMGNPAESLALTQDETLKYSKMGWAAEAIDVVIDFSLPEMFPEVLKWCQQNQKPLVSGVTGLGEISLDRLNQLLGPGEKLKCPVFWSSNMSIGIALVKKFIAMANIFNANEFFISETHHVHKKDSPSGTAISLAHAIKNNFGSTESVPIEAFRKEEVFGIHEVTLRSDDEILRIYHEAKNRRVFASGAIKVSEWMFRKRKNPQLYLMEDFIQDVENP